ncbi:TfuA-like protein [Brachybacterium sp. DNPG3]
MSTVVDAYLGPTLAVDVARALARAAGIVLRVHPPARCGDLARLLEASAEPPVVLLVDGVYEREPALWHKEILAVLAAGGRVIGCSSTGALRAVECAPWGAEPVGTIAAAYADGTRTSDADVAVAHAGPEDEHRALSVPLVDVDAACDDALARDILDSAQAERLRSAARDRFYAARTWRGLLADLTEPTEPTAPTAPTALTEPAVRRLRAEILEGPGRKEQDAREAIAALPALLRRSPERIHDPAAVPATQQLQAVLAEARAAASTGGAGAEHRADDAVVGDVGAVDLLDRLAEEERWPELMRAGLVRALVAQGLVPGLPRPGAAESRAVLAEHLGLPAGEAVELLADAWGATPRARGADRAGAAAARCAVGRPRDGRPRPCHRPSADHGRAPRSCDRPGEHPMSPADPRPAEERPVEGRPAEQRLAATVRALSAIAWPVILSGLVTLFISGNDTILLAGASDRVLASAVASSSVHAVAAMVVAGLVGAGQVLISRAMGAGCRDHAARAADTGLWVGLWAGAATAILLALLGPFLLSALAGPAIDGAFASTYLSITLIALPCIGISSALRARCAGLGRARGLLVAAACAAVVDVGAAISLNLLLGPFGVAIGTVLGSATNMLILLLIAVRRLPASTGVRGPRAASFVRVDRTALRALLALGWPEAILYGASSGAAVVATWLLSAGPSAELAASRFLELTIGSIVFTVLAGFGTAATTLLGRAAGAEDHQGFRRVLRHSLLLTLSIGALVLALGLVGYLPLLRLIAPETVVAASAGVVGLALAQIPLMALHVPITSALRTLKDTRGPMIASLVAEYAVFLPLGWFLTRILPLGLTGVFIDHLVFWAVSVLIIAVRLRPRYRALGAAVAAPRPAVLLPS